MKIAYIMSRFPHLPETFILREMSELEIQGEEVVPYPLIFQKQPLIHAEAQKWLGRVRCTPFFSFQILAIDIQYFLKMPLKILAMFFTIIGNNLTNPTFLIKSLALFPKAIYLARCMQNDKIQHIHAHYATYPTLVAWVINQLTGIGYSVTVHAHDIFEHKDMLATKLKNADFVVAISEYNRTYLSDNLGQWILEKIHVIHCGIQPDLYSNICVNDTIEGRFEVLNIGSLEPYKGQCYLIQACALLRNQNVPIHLQIIGMGPERAALQKLILQLNLEGHVELLGPKKQEEIAQILPECHCYVQPSIITKEGTMEGIPVALMEAMACGLPTLATAISGIPELIQDGQTGYLVPPEDPNSLAKALLNIFNDYKKSRKMGEKGRENILINFQLQKNVSSLKNIFNQQFRDFKD